MDDDSLILITSEPSTMYLVYASNLSFVESHNIIFKQPFYFRDDVEVLIFANHMESIGFVLSEVFIMIRPEDFKGWHYPRPLVNPQPSMN